MKIGVRWLSALDCKLWLDGKEIHYYNNHVEIIEDKDGMVIVSSRSRTGNCFSFLFNIQYILKGLLHT